jgi:predicted lipoprotein with Yx(FWY)xxD motif
MKTANIALAASMALAVLTGCGSSSKNASSSASAPAASAPAQGAYSQATSSSSSPSTTVAVVTTKHNKLGTVLAAGPKKLTVYMFEADTGTSTSCTGTCASVWPPVTTGGQPQATGRTVASDLGTMTRPDGARQVTYKGHPIYYYAKDGDAGDAYGAGIKSFGAGWYVLAPSGKKIDNS